RGRRVDRRAVCRGRASLHAEMVCSAGRVAGRLASVLIGAFALWRRRSLRNVDILILLFSALALAIVSVTTLTDTVLGWFSFHKGGGGRILGLAVFAIVILFLLILRNMSMTVRFDGERSGVLEGSGGAWLRPWSRWAAATGAVRASTDDADRQPLP